MSYEVFALQVFPLLSESLSVELNEDPLMFKVLLHQARASADRRAVDPQTSATFENAQHTRVLSRVRSGKQ